MVRSMPRALIIDDETLVAETLVGMLESRGWACATAADGEAGLAVLAEFAPDVVFLDMMMPVLDGLRTLPLIRRDHPRVFVVAMSGGNRDSAGEILDKAKRLGCGATLAKPFGLADVKQLLARLDRAVPARASP